MPLQLLALAGTFRSLDPLLAQLLIYVGRASLTTRVSVVAAVVLPLMFLAGSRYGAAGVAAAWLIGHPIVVLLHTLVLVRRVTGITIRDFSVALWPATTGIAVMVPAVLMALEASGPGGEIVRLAAGVAVGAVSYVGTVLLLHRRRLLLMLAWLRRGRPDHE